MTMTAAVHDRYGSACDVLRVEQVARPQVADDEVLLRVHAAGVDRGVWHVMTGLPYPVRLAGYGLRAPKARVRGSDVAGRVEAVGRAVTGLQVGDEVFGSGAQDSLVARSTRSCVWCAPSPPSMSRTRRSSTSTRQPSSRWRSTSEGLT